MMLIAPPLLTFLGSLGSWMLYSQILKIMCHPVSVHNTIVSQTRPEGNMTLMQELVDTLPLLTENASLYCHPIWDATTCATATAAHGSVHSTNRQQTMKQLGKNMAVDSESLSIFGKVPIPNTTLSSLVHSKPNGRLLVDPLVFKTWMQRLTEVSTLLSKHDMPMLAAGSFTYTFRDYWNYEESHALQNQRGSIRRWKLRTVRPTAFTFYQNGSCTLTDSYVVEGMIPMRIQWVGRVMNKNDQESNSETASEMMTIVWTSTVLHKGWNRFGGKTIHRPPLAELYRKQPWNILFYDGELLIMERVGSGRLVFRRDNTFV